MPENDDPENIYTSSEEPNINSASPQDDEATLLATVVTPTHEVIGDFEILAKLGAGGMGTVYRARQVSLGRLVALKILPPHAVEDPDTVARFRREARVAASLTHGNLVKVFSAGEADGCHYIAMELIEGEDLGQRIRREKKLPIPEALRIIADVARGLNHGWKNAQIVHRDIKPGNIFLSAHGEVKLGDLGLAKSALSSTTSGITQTGTMMGTPYYISPEQARAEKELDFRADIYSLGCTLYHMLTGEVPYKGTEPFTIIRQHLDAPLPAIMKVMPQCPIVLARLVGKMLKKSRHERHGSYDELIAQMESVWAQLDPLSFNPEAFAPPPALDPDATMLQSDTVDAAATTPRVATARATATIQAKPKSKLPLYGGIAAGVIALGVVTAVIWPKKASPPKPAATANSVPPAAPQGAPAANTATSATAPASAQWLDLLKDPHSLKLTGPTERMPDGLHITGRCDGTATSGPSPVNGAVRARAIFGNNRPTLGIRINSAGGYNLGTNPNGKSLKLMRWENATSTSTVLAEYNLKQRLLSGMEYSVGFAIIGQTLIAMVDGQVVGTASDPSFTKGGYGFSCSASATDPVVITSLETLKLDGLSEDDAIRLITSPEARVVDLARANFASLKLDAKTAELQDGVLLLKSLAHWRLPDFEARNMIARATIRWEQGRTDLKLRLRTHVGTQNKTDSIFAHLRQNPPQVGYATQDSGGEPALQTFALPAPIEDGRDIVWELAVIGSRAFLRIDGQLIGTADNLPITAAGGVSIQALNALVKKLEMIDLDSLSEDDAWKFAEKAAVRVHPGGKWHNLVTNRTAVLEKGATFMADGLEMPRGSAASAPPETVGADGAVRMQTTFDPVVQNMSLRARWANGAGYWLTIKSPEGIRLERQVPGAKFSTIENYPVPTSLKPGELYQLELHVVGTELRSYLNGVLLGKAEDSAIKEGGAFGALYGTGGTPSVPTMLLKSLEYQPLGGASDNSRTSPSSGASTRPTAPDSAPWQKLVPTDAILRGNNGTINAAGEWHIEGAAVLAKPSAVNVAIRGEVRMLPPSPSAYFHLRGGDHFRTLNLSAKDLRLMLGDTALNGWPTLKHLPYPSSFASTGEWLPIQFAVVGQTSIAKLATLPVVAGENGEAIAAGGIKIGGPTGGGSDFRNIEYLTLDDLPESQWPEFVREGLKKANPGQR